ncbi:MAG: hypothetical protein HYY10_00085 [Candidatus Liptonbacteria bacterium]|nr:hypothetical protein [Candidatus Liptonbacteria bacterium]
MPLPQKVIDRLSREPLGTPGWSSQLLLFSGALFLISVIVYGGVAFGYKPHFEGRIKKLNDQIQAFTQQIPLAQQEKITSFYAQLSNVKKLLDQHAALTPFLKWFQEHTQANIFYRQFSVEVTTGKVMVSGTGKSLGDVEEQLAIFERAKEVKESLFGSVTSKEKVGWEFSGTLTFPPGFFTSKGAK